MEQKILNFLTIYHHRNLAKLAIKEAKEIIQSDLKVKK